MAEQVIFAWCQQPNLNIIYGKMNTIWIKLFDMLKKNKGCPPVIEVFEIDHHF
ncbi:43534_t:CDS:1, partial [Gigaspora margarita]